MLRNLLISLGFAAICLLNPVHLAIGTEQSTDQTLAQLEIKFFEHQYSDDSDIDRVNRIEQFIFGCTQTGAIDKRVQHIVAAIPDVSTDKVLNGANSNADNNTSLDKNQMANHADNDQNTNQNDQNDDQSNNTADDKSDYSSYPRVTALEQELLGHNYETDTLPRRLARLETKVFGKVSTSNDLGERVDNLDDYAQRHDIYGDRKIANNTNSNLSFVPPKYMRTPPKSVYPDDNSLASTDTDEPQQSYTSKTGSFVGSMEERVAMMEAQEFDHTYPEKSLDKRLRKLEKKILPNQDDSQLGLFQRTSKLWIALHPSDKNTMDNLIADNDTGSTSSSFAPASSSSSTSTSATNSTSAKHSSWLHKLANEVESSTNSPYSGYSNFSGNTGTAPYPYPGSFYVPQSATYPRSRFIGGSFGPGAGPGGSPVGFW